MTNQPASEKTPVREIVFMDKPAKPPKPEGAEGFPDLAEIKARMQAAMTATTTGRHGDGGIEMSEEKRALFNLLEVLHLPEWSPSPSVKMKPDRIQIAQALRVTDALLSFGVRVNEHLATLKWVPTPGAGANNPHDMGTFLTRNEDGSWPVADPEDFFDPDEITVEQAADGQYVAIHAPSGIVEYAKSASRAKLAASAKLLQRIEEAAEVDQAG